MSSFTYDDLLKEIGKLTLVIEEIKGTIRIYQYSLETWETERAKVIKQAEELKKELEKNA